MREECRKTEVNLGSPVLLLRSLYSRRGGAHLIYIPAHVSPLHCLRRIPNQPQLERWIFQNDSLMRGFNICFCCSYFLPNYIIGRPVMSGAIVRFSSTKQQIRASWESSAGEATINISWVIRRLVLRYLLGLFILLRRSLQQSPSIWIHKLSSEQQPSQENTTFDALFGDLCWNKSFSSPPVVLQMVLSFNARKDKIHIPALFPQRRNVYRVLVSVCSGKTFI